MVLASVLLHPNSINGMGLRFTVPVIGFQKFFLSICGCNCIYTLKNLKYYTNTNFADSQTRLGKWQNMVKHISLHECCVSNGWSWMFCCFFFQVNWSKFLFSVESPDTLSSSKLKEVLCTRVALKSTKCQRMRKKHYPRRSWGYLKNEDLKISYISFPILTRKIPKHFKVQL